MTKTLADITQRLAAIEVEQAQLSQTDHDALLAQAIVSGSGVDQVEADQANAERLAKRLRIEHETLTAMIPEAKRIEAAPELDKVKKAHAAKIAESAKAISQALKQWEAFKSAIDLHTQLKAEAVALTQQARQIATEAGAVDPIAEMGAPISRKLQNAGEQMSYLGRDLHMQASVGMFTDTGYVGQSVDPVAVEGAV